MMSTGNHKEGRLVDFLLINTAAPVSGPGRRAIQHDGNGKLTILFGPYVNITCEGIGTTRDG
jgi:hypothetical protein